METSRTMDELRKIKEQCSQERLARTPEEEARHTAEVMGRAEELLGRPIKVANTLRGQTCCSFTKNPTRIH